MGWVIAVPVIVAILVVIWLVLSSQKKGRQVPPPAKLPIPTKRATKLRQTRQVLERGYAGRQRVTMKYETGNPLPGEPATKVRDIDVYGLGEEYFDAYCYYRNEVRTFKISRVLWANLTSGTYQIPNTYVPSSWVTYGWGEVQDRELEPTVEVLCEKAKSSPLMDTDNKRHWDRLRGDANSDLPAGKSTEGQRVSRQAAPLGRSEEHTQSYVRYDWQKRFEESILSPFPEELSPALPYLREAHRLEEEGADQAKIAQMLAKARQADSDATTFYLIRWSIIKRRRQSRHHDQGNALLE